MTTVENNPRMTGYWWRSLVAMLLSLTTLTALLALVTGGIEWVNEASFDRASETSLAALGFGIIVTLFALVGWLVFVLPFTWTDAGKGWLSHSKFCEIRWAVLGVLSFNAIFLALSQGWYALPFSWIPAIIGAAAGAYFRWLTRRSKDTERVNPSA